MRSRTKSTQRGQRQHPEAIQVQRLRIEHLERFVAFAQGAREETPNSLLQFVQAVYGDRSKGHAFTPDELAEFKGQLFRWLMQIATGVGWEIESRELGPYSIHVVAGGTYLHDVAGDALPRLALVKALTGEEWRIGRCGWILCNRLFVRRKTGNYCDPKHSQAMRALRYADPEAASDLERSRQKAPTGTLGTEQTQHALEQLTAHGSHKKEK